MLVCLCEGVSERAIEEAVRDGATSIRELSRRTRAGTNCASCVCDLRTLLRRRACVTAAVPVADPDEDALAAK
jgi:bacterioferritin-associated ferredoxin